MKYLLLFFALMTSAVQANSLDSLNQKSWIHGSENCEKNKDPAIDVFQYTDTTFVLRQNKCVHYEAPFIYVLFGEHTVFVQDTGATAEADNFPLYETLQKLISRWQKSHNNEALNILVTHSHSHGDHTAADPQFDGKPAVTLIKPDKKSVKEYFGFKNWPNELASLDLGKRKLTIIAIPGHQEESIAIYDPQTKWLLSGDTIYPGRLYVKNWATYKTSIRRLAEFSQTHEIGAIMGTHIEMSNSPGQDYPMGSTYQPDEARLALSVEDLLSLDSALEKAGTKPRKLLMPKFIVTPINTVQRILGGVLGWVKKSGE